MRLHHLVILTAAATLVLMVIGSLVHGTGSSLACPDWPLCHGTAFPAMTGGVEFEHTHRLVAASVVALTVAVAIGAWRRPDRRALGLATSACALVGLQAALGGLTVLLRLPPAVSIAHLATSMTFLSTLVLLAVRTTPVVHTISERAGALRPWLGVAAGLVMVQIVLGGVVRHTGAAMACPSVPLCAGSLWPEALLPRLHVLHRATGLVAFGATAGVSVAALRRSRGWLRALSIAPAGAALLQVSLGVAVVLAGAPLGLVTIHHATAAVLLATLVASWALAGGANHHLSRAR